MNSKNEKKRNKHETKFGGTLKKVIKIVSPLRQENRDAQTLSNELKSVFGKSPNAIHASIA